MEAREWVVPGERMKRGFAHRVPLSEATVPVLESVQGHDNELVFPSVQRVVNHTELKPILQYMRTLASGRDENWATGFARSILRNAKRSSWRPSEKQAAAMRRLFLERLGPDEEIQLIED